MKKWKTRLKVWKDRPKETSEQILITTGFLPEENYSPVGFIGMLLSKLRGYRLRMLGRMSVKRAYMLRGNKRYRDLV